MKKYIGSIPNGKTDTKMPGNQLCVGMPSSLDAYLELNGPKAMVFDDMMMQCANSELIAQAFTQKRHHQNLSVILILQNLYCQGKVMRNVHLNTEYVVLFRNHEIRINFDICQDNWNRKTPKHSWTLTWTPPRDRTRISWWI